MLDRYFITYLRLPPPGNSPEQLKEGERHVPGLALYNYKRSQIAEEVVGQICARRGMEALEANLTDVSSIPLLFNL